MDICTVNFTTENEGIQREKAALKFHFWQKTRFTHAIAPSKRANSQNLETDLNLLTITFHLLTEQSYTSFINSWWKWVILSVRSLTVFKEKIPVTDIELKFVCQTSAVDVVVVVFFFKTCMRFCFLHALYFTGVRLWQILVKKKKFQSLFGSLLNHLFHYTNKNISVKPLFNLHYLSLFQLPFTRSKIVQFMEDLAVITAQNH